MPEPNLFLVFVRPLNRLGIRYMIGGSVATMFYGEPRVTHDVDVIVFLNERDIHRLPKVFLRQSFTCRRRKLSSLKFCENREATSTSSITSRLSKLTCISWDVMNSMPGDFATKGLLSAKANLSCLPRRSK